MSIAKQVDVAGIAAKVQPPTPLSTAARQAFCL